MIALDDLVSENLVLLDPPVADVAGVFEAMVAKIEAAGILPESKVPALREALVKREAVGSTGLGEGIALPHAYMAGLGRSLVLVARLAQPMEFGSHDGQPVDLFFLITGPPSEIRFHLQVLARLARLLRDGQGLRELREASTPRQVVTALLELEARH